MMAQTAGLVRNGVLLTWEQQRAEVFEDWCAGKISAARADEMLKTISYNECARGREEGGEQ